MAEELTIGLDIGGTKMAFVVADRHGNIHHASSLPTEAQAEFTHALNRIAGHLNSLIARFISVRGIGVGVPGPVDSDRGIALHAANLGWKNVGLRDAIAERLSRPLPIHLENDVNAGAIGEQLFGAAKGISNCLYLIVGTGLGGAVISNNRRLRGASDSEMEIGHVALDPINGLPCACGQRGCLEMTASGKGIVAQALDRIADYPDSRLSAQAITTRQIIRLAEEGDALAATVMNEAAQALGIACAWCVNLFNPSLIIVAGGLARASWHLLEKPLLQSMRARCLPMNYEVVTVSLSKLTDGALGASALVWHKEEQTNRS
ncbi:MAG: ROK family protein [Chloroflexi bacterium]|nr:ROK family protein [Chloroflexota bacterium]